MVFEASKRFLYSPIKDNKSTCFVNCSLHFLGDAENFGFFPYLYFVLFV